MHEDKKDGPAIVAAQTKSELSADGFWKLVDRLRQGRRLVITGDHGYADANSFSNEEKNEETVKLLRSFLGPPGVPRKTRPSPGRHSTCRRWFAGTMVGWSSWASKWAVQGGFPNLCHRGLSLLETAVPFIEYPPK